MNYGLLWHSYITFKTLYLGLNIREKVLEMIDIVCKDWSYKEWKMFRGEGDNEPSNMVSIQRSLKKEP